MTKLEKLCTKCGTLKLLADFYKRKETKSGYRSHCKNCVDEHAGKIRDIKRGHNKKGCIHFSNEDKMKDDELSTWYMAGLLAADGNINNKNGVSLTLHPQDLETIEFFKKYFEYTGDIKLYKNKYPYCILNKVPKLVNTLNERFNITKRKSLTLKPPKNIPTVEHSLAYIIGYIDGDGCIYVKDKFKQIQILGTKEILDFILNTFSNYCDIQIQPRKSSSKNVFQINLSGNLTSDKCKYYQLIKKLNFKGHSNGSKTSQDN
jgi:hypothetical protein